MILSNEERIYTLEAVVALTLIPRNNNNTTESNPINLSSNNSQEIATKLLQISPKPMASKLLQIFPKQMSTKLLQISPKPIHQVPALL